MTIAFIAMTCVSVTFYSNLMYSGNGWLYEYRDYLYCDRRIRDRFFGSDYMQCRDRFDSFLLLLLLLVLVVLML